MTAEGEPVAQFERLGAVAVVTLNRPGALNALDRDLTEALGRLADRLAAEPGLRVAVTRGAGRAFCAGNDLKETAAFTEAEAETIARRQAALLDRWAALPCITLAAVHGFALGGGLLLAAAHDLRMAAEGTRFGLPEITLGWPPAYGIQRLVRLLGEAAAREAILTGRQFGAQEARRIRLVNRVAPDAGLPDAALAWAGELARLPEAGIRAAKHLLAEGAGPDRGGEPAAFARCLTAPEAQARLRELLKPKGDG